MGQTLYLECNSGISGDMTVAALLDLGADEKVLRTALESMPLSGFEIEISKVKKSGLDVCDFNVKLDKAHENHDHDMEYLYGHEAESGYRHEYECVHYHGHDHGHEHECGHHHEHEHECRHHHGHDHGHHHMHEHRGLLEIQQIIEHTDITKRAKAVAFRIFNILAQAEAKAHGVDINAVHFHEVGAVDAIVDIVAVAVCLDDLDITEVIVPYLCEGYGTVRCQHGILSVPVPAVANIVQMNGLKMQLTKTAGELVTPTGAAIAAAVITSDKLPAQFKILRIGMGAGKRNYERPSILRGMLIEAVTEKGSDDIYKLETNIDDSTGEMLGYVMDRLYEKGARDVHYTPVFMKKNRPAYELTVICDQKDVPVMENIIFKETTTIGIRKLRMERAVLEREIECVDLGIGEIKVKKCVLPDGTVRKYPEYETVAALAGKSGKAFKDILALYQEVSGGCVQ